MRIGIDLGGTKIEGVVLDHDGHELLRKRVSTRQSDGYQAILHTIKQLVGHLEAEMGKKCSVGIGTPGAISAVTGTMKNSNTVCLNGRPLLEDLQTLMHRPLRIANDANCFTLSEALDGPDCYCGHKGCVETLISGPGLAADFQRYGGDSVLLASDIVALAARGDALAEAALQRFFDRFGRAMAMVVNILDPDAIILGGGLSNVERLYSEGRERVAHYVFNDEFITPILENAHGDSSGVRGGSAIVAQ